MQKPTLTLLSMGPLPPCTAISTTHVDTVSGLLAEINAPVSNEDARALARLLGPDDCFGMAWSLIHLIESTPGWPLGDVLCSLAEPWSTLLSDRANSGTDTP